MNPSYQKGKQAFESGYYCAESVLKVIAKEEGIVSDIIPGIATGFCSGMSRTGSMCGAVTGGILALNLLYGRRSQAESVELNYDAVQQLITEFEAAFGSVNCGTLLGCDLGTPEGQKIFTRDRLHEKCMEFTGRATQLTRAIIDGA